jgi:superfamily I DNA and/or RNA helicase
MGRSIFEVTVPEPHNSPLVALLDTQYRMHPAIGTLVSDLFYGGRLLNGPNTAGRSAQTSREPFAGKPLVLLDTAGAGRCETAEGSYSRLNRHSAALCVEFCVQALAGGVEQVAVITPYAAQSRLIREQLRARQVDPQRVSCHTVHRFQGNECELVILDTVDTAPLKPGVLLTGEQQSANLLNVSISRAKAKLVVIADVGFLRREASKSVLRKVLDMLRTRGVVVSQ